MNILVTGGSGFIGTVLVRNLLQSGHHVVIYDKKMSETYPENCTIGDVRDGEALIASSREVDAIYHLAAEHRDDVSPVSLYYDVNVEGARNLVRACEENSISRLIFTSTVALYGLNANMPDENSPAQPFNDYGKSKYEAERIFSNWAKHEKRRSLIMIRPAVIFGERNRGNVYNLINQVSTNKFIMVGSGKNRKSMGYVENIAKFLLQQLNTAPGISLFNFADKPDLTSRELITVILKALGRKPRVTFGLPYALGMSGGYFFDFLAKLTGRSYPVSSIRVKKFCADTRISTDKLQKTGFIPPYSLQEGLTKFISSDFL